MKKIIIALTLLFTLMLSGVVQAATTSQQSDLLVCGKPVDFIIRIVPYENTVKPVTKLSIRDTAAALGYSIDWDDVNQVANIKSPGETVTSKAIGNVILETKVSPSVAWAVYQDHVDIVSDGTSYTYAYGSAEQQPEIRNGRLFVSLEAVKQIFGLKERS